MWSRWKPSYQMLNSLNMWPESDTHTRTGASSFIARQWSLFLDCLHTHTLKTKTAGLKMGPCHSPLGVNLLCPQSCFSLSHFSPFLCVLIARWIWSSHHLVVFRRISLPPSATRRSDRQITSADGFQMSKWAHPDPFSSCLSWYVERCIYWFSFQRVVFSFLGFLLLSLTLETYTRS